MKSIGTVLTIVGCVAADVGLALLLAPKLPWLGRLPGDIHYQGRNTSVHFPVVMCIVISVMLTVIVSVVLRWFRR